LASVNFIFTVQHRQAPSQACVCYARFPHMLWYYTII
jgi:hypothetical protein